MADIRPHPAAPPSSRPIAYWRRPPKPGARQAATAPLEPLSTRQAVGLVVVALLIAALVLFSVAWWARVAHG